METTQMASRFGRVEELKRDRRNGDSSICTNGAIAALRTSHPHAKEVVFGKSNVMRSLIWKQVGKDVLFMEKSSEWWRLCVNK